MRLRRETGDFSINVHKVQVDGDTTFTFTPAKLPAGLSQEDFIGAVVNVVIDSTYSGEGGEPDVTTHEESVSVVIGTSDRINNQSVAGYFQLITMGANNMITILYNKETGALANTLPAGE